MEKGTVTIGIDYYTDVVRENAIMQDQIRSLRRFLTNEHRGGDKLVYVTEVARIFGFNIEDPVGYQE